MSHPELGYQEDERQAYLLAMHKLWEEIRDEAAQMIEQYTQPRTGSAVRESDVQ